MDEEYDIPREVEIQEVVDASSGRLSLKDFSMNYDFFDTEALGEAHELNKKIEMQMTHCLHPEWLSFSLDKTLKKLNVETLDCLFLSDPIEHLFEKYKSTKEVLMRLGHAFAFCEEMVQEGKIKAYGVQSSRAFLIDPLIESI